MKHFKPNAWANHEMTPERTAQWFKAQSDEQIAVLSKHNVWYGPEHLRPAPVEPEPEPEQASLDGLSLPERIIELCARWHKINAMAVRAKFRGVKAVKARQVAAYLLHKHCTSDTGEPMTNTAIGQTLGGRDRTTVMHSIKVVTVDLRKEFGAVIEHVETKLGLR